MTKTEKEFKNISIVGGHKSVFSKNTIKKIDPNLISHGHYWMRVNITYGGFYKSDKFQSNLSESEFFAGETTRFNAGIEGDVGRMYTNLWNIYVVPIQYVRPHDERWYELWRCSYTLPNEWQLLMPKRCGKCGTKHKNLQICKYCEATTHKGLHIWKSYEGECERLGYLCDDCRKKYIEYSETIKGKTVCSVLKNHHRALENDPERLSTEFMKKMMEGAADDCDVE